MLEIFKKSPKKELIPSLSNISTLAREGNDLFSDTLILLDERLSGNLFCAEKIVVEQNGILSGNITSKSCVVSGTINGNIVSTDQMDIKSTAVIKGNIKSALINIEPGAVINGCVTIAEDSAAMINLTEKIKEHSERDLQDKLYPGIPQLNSESGSVIEPVKLNWEFKSAEELDKIKLDNLSRDVQPDLELKEINWAFNSSDDNSSDESISNVVVTTDKVNEVVPEAKEIITPKAEEPKQPALLAATEKKPITPDPEKKDEGSQRWW